MASKPSDHFDAGSLVLLQHYCEIAVQAELLMERRRAMDLPGSTVDDAAAARLERRGAAHVKMLATLATKLRLSVQARVRYDDGRLDEKAPPAHRLLGGNVAPFTGPKR